MLNVDKFFFESLRNSEAVVSVTNGRIFNPARPEIDEEEDLIPYIIITYDGGSSDGDTKDSTLAVLTSATVSVLCVAEERDDLAGLSELVADTIEANFENEDLYGEHDDWNFCISAAAMTAGPVEYDPAKPCCFQRLTYVCETERK